MASPLRRCFVISGVIWTLLFVVFNSESVSASGTPLSADASQAINITTENHISSYYDGEYGECRISCEYHDSTGAFSMGFVYLRVGQGQNWIRPVDEHGPDSIHCDFFWTSQSKAMDYDVFSKGQGDLQHTATMWSVTEVGLFEQSAAGIYSMVTGWSG